MSSGRCDKELDRKITVDLAGDGLVVGMDVVDLTVHGFVGCW